MCTCHVTCVEVREQLVRVDSFLPPGRTQGLRSDHQAWQGPYLLILPTDFIISIYDFLFIPVLKTDETIAAAFADAHI